MHFNNRFAKNYSVFTSDYYSCGDSALSKGVVSRIALIPRCFSSAFPLGRKTDEENPTASTDRKSGEFSRGVRRRHTNAYRIENRSGSGSLTKTTPFYLFFCCFFFNYLFIFYYSCFNLCVFWLYVNEVATKLRKTLTEAGNGTYDSVYYGRSVHRTLNRR